MVVPPLIPKGDTPLYVAQNAVLSSCLSLFWSKRKLNYPAALFRPRLELPSLDCVLRCVHKNRMSPQRLDVLHRAVGRYYDLQPHNSVDIHPPGDVRIHRRYPSLDLAGYFAPLLRHGGQGTDGHSCRYQRQANHQRSAQNHERHKSSCWQGNADVAECTECASLGRLGNASRIWVKLQKVGRLAWLQPNPAQAPIS